MNKESLIRLIEKVGKWEAAKLLGISLFDLLKITKSPLLHADECNDVLLELISKNYITTEYEGFNISVNDYEGIVSWIPKTPIRTKHKGQQLIEGIMVYATPYWDGNSLLPYNVEYYELVIDGEPVANEEQPDFRLVKKIPGRFRNVDELIEWYKEVYLPGVYDNIMNTILPQLRAEYI